MTDESPSAWFTLTHQRNVVEIDFAGVITASAFLTIQPTNPSLQAIYLHASPLMTVKNVTLSSATTVDPLHPTPASFALVNPFQPLPTRDPPIDMKSHPEIKRKMWATMAEADEGELAISVSGGWVRLQPAPGQDSHVAFAPIHVQVDYQLVIGGDVVEGIVFKRPGDAGNEYQIPHMFLSPTTYNSARSWTPCIDSLFERCTWELEFIVPKYLEGGDSDGEKAYPVMVVSSGELMEQTTHPHDPNKVIFYYLQANPTSVQHISFAAGPFEMHCISAEESHKPIIGFCLPGELEWLENSTSFLPRVMAFTTELGSYPFTDFKIVFVNNLRTECVTAATLAIVSSDLLHPPSIIEQAIEVRKTLSLALIQQWIGINIIQRTFSDTWIVNGVALYILGQFLRHLLGNNEYRFRLKKDIERCVLQDQGSQYPLCMPGIIEPPDAPTTAFINLKAPAVLHILDRYLAKAGTSLGLSQVIPRIFMAALSDALPGNTLTTGYFLRQCRKVSGLDMGTFADQWIYGSGCPRLSVRTNFIKKKFTVELSVSQTIPAIEYLNSLSEKQQQMAIWKRPTQFFEGSLTVRIHEADGAPFEHLIDIKTSNKTFALPFNTKYKRTRRSGHIAARFHKAHTEVDETLNEDEDEAQLQAADRAGIFAYPPWEDEDERRRWKVAEWDEGEANAMLGEGGGYEWIRVDPDCEWLTVIEFAERPWCWISQLQGDRDVIAQIEAIYNMRMYPSPVVASELAKTVLVKNYFYRVRMEAARALSLYNTSECDYIGYFLIMKLFQTCFCYASTTSEAEAPEIRCRPLPNDFSNIADYFVKKSLIAAMADLRDPATRSVWKNVRIALLDLIRLNDNTTNRYSDSYYLAAIIAAISNAFTISAAAQGILSESELESEQLMLKEAKDVLDRAMTVDRLVPSFHNVVTKAGLQAQIKSILAGQRTNDARELLSYTREGNYEPIRKIAFDGLLLCKPPGRSGAVDQYLFDVIKYDHSLTIRRYVTRALSESILVSLALGEITSAIPLPGVLDLTDETEQMRTQRAEGQNNAIVKALRKDFGNKLDVKQLVQDNLIESVTLPDMEIRFALLKLAEVISSSTTEPLPGNIITLTTPLIETPVAPPPPKIRISMSGGGIVSQSQPTHESLMEESQPVVPRTIPKIILNTKGNATANKKKK
nr:transcription initiation factor TFIID subunit 2 [Cryptococcus depauperatus CBS 7841]